MEWPARSPDLNPIEHAWDMLQTAVSSRPVQPASVQELRQALFEEWDQIPQYKTCADPDIFLRGGPTENALVLLYDTLISGFQWV